MASENKRGNRETKKPKKVVQKTNASAPSTKGTGPATVSSIKKK